MNDVDIFQTYVSFGVQALSPPIIACYDCDGAELRVSDKVDNVSSLMFGKGSRIDVIDVKQRMFKAADGCWYQARCFQRVGPKPTLKEMEPLRGNEFREEALQLQTDGIERPKKAELIPWSCIEDVPVICWVRHKDYLHKRCQLITKLSDYGPLKPDVSWAFLFSTYEWADSPRGPWKVCGKN